MSMLSAKSLTTVIPCFNAESTLARAIESVLAQEQIIASQIFVIDDCSTDRSMLIAREYKVEILQTKTNLGSGGAKNFGFSKVTTPFVIFLDADDYWNVDFIEIQTAKWKTADKNTAAISLSMDIEGSIGTKSFIRHSIRNNVNKSNIQIADLLDRNPMSSSVTVFRTEALKSIGGYCNHSPVDDFETISDLVLHGYELKTYIDIGGVYTISEGQVTANPQVQYAGQCRVFEKYLKNNVISTLEFNQTVSRHWLKSLARCAQYKLPREKIPKPYVSLPFPMAFYKILDVALIWGTVGFIWRAYVSVSLKGMSLPWKRKT